MLVTLTEIIDGVAEKECAIPAFNVFGYEDAQAVIAAAEQLDAPVILATNKVAIEHMSIKHLGKLLCSMAESAKVPVCVHLDHGKDYDTVAQAIMSGYSSVMYDGSQLPLAENIRSTQEIVKMAHACGIPVEAEIGSVGYSDPSMNVKAFYTEPEEARTFAEETEVDALAVAVGSLHRMEQQAAKIQFDRLQAIQDLVGTPLVIHGSTGITDADVKRLVTFNVVKVNIGTALRMAFGHSLREAVIRQPEQYDRIALFEQPMKAVQAEAVKKMKLLGLGK